MAFKKMKKGMNTLTNVVMILILVLGIFFGAYLYIAENVESAGLELDSKYEGAYDNLTTASTDLEENVEEIKTNFDDIKEADNTFEAAWNGLKGLGATLKLPINFVNTVLTTWTSMVPVLDIVPGWVLPLVFIGLLALIVFLVLKILKGEPNM